MKDISRQLQNLENSNHIQILQKIENFKLNLIKPSWLTASFPVWLNSDRRRHPRLKSVEGIGCTSPLASFDANGERKRCLS